MSEEDEDWFERAVDSSGTEEADGSEAGGTDEVEGSEASGTDEVDGSEATETEATDSSDERSEAFADATLDPETFGDGSPPGTGKVGGDDGGEDSLFEEDFATALENVEVPTVDGDGGPAGFDDLEFGLDGPSESNFDEDPESALARIDLGIEGLDGMIQGGVPERSLMVAIGGAGTGKTTFGIQFLAHGLAEGERAVFVTLEETRERVIDSATEKGFPFDEYAAEGRLAVVDVDPVEMANSLTSIRSELPRLIDEFEASRLVLDSVSLLEMMYDDRADRRNEIFDFARSLKEAGVTALLTSEASEETRYASRFGIVEYLTDAVFVMQYVRPDDFRETRLAIEIQKIRDANHSRETKPYEITGEGISVYQQANLF